MGQVYQDQMFNTTAAAASLTQMNTGTTAAAGSYAPQTRGRLIAVHILCSGQAATSLIEQLRIEMNSVIWTPNTLKLVAVGAGIRTAPANQIEDFDWMMDEPVQTDIPINANYVFNVTAVTPNIVVVGTFSTNPIAVAPYRGE